MTLEVVLATHNRHKVAEFHRILSMAVPTVTVDGYDGPEPVEDGITFAENALIKARIAAGHTGRVAMADDSGICVDVLGGAPGIFSARWAGAHGSDGANLSLLLNQLADIRDPHRRAHFVCTIAVVIPGDATRAGREHLVEGIWRGRIATEPRGENGFGYDPIFLPDGFEVSAAQLSAAQKNTHSHRSRAFAKLVPELRRLIAPGG